MHSVYGVISRAPSRWSSRRTGGTTAGGTTRRWKGKGCVESDDGAPRRLVRHRGDGVWVYRVVFAGRRGGVPAPHGIFRPSRCGPWPMTGRRRIADRAPSRLRGSTWRRAVRQTSRLSSQGCYAGVASRSNSTWSGLQQWGSWRVVISVRLRRWPSSYRKSAIG